MLEVCTLETLQPSHICAVATLTRSSYLYSTICYKTAQASGSMIRTTETGAVYPASFRLTIILLSLFLGTFLVAIDTTIVSVAIPKISTQFHSLNDVGWYGSAYLITITAFQPAGGTIYKLFNAKWVYLTAIVVFEGTSIIQPSHTKHLTDFGSGLGSMRSCSEFPSVHIGEGSGRLRCCAADPGSYKRHHTCIYAGKAPSLHRSRRQLFWHLRKFQSNTTYWAAR